MITGTESDNETGNSKVVAVARVHVDATGRFPVKSANGYSYDLLFYIESANYIHIQCYV
jgi:hypothetical protein